MDTGQSLSTHPSFPHGLASLGRVVGLFRDLALCVCFALLIIFRTDGSRVCGCLGFCSAYHTVTSLTTAAVWKVVRRTGRDIRPSAE